MNPIAVILIICIAGLGCWFLSGIIEWLMRDVDRNPHGQPDIENFKEGYDD